jgi:class 3 adenylate cyclase
MGVGSVLIDQSLAATTRQGTADLALRVGLNSGPTTAGVLRGEKSRFQLFGDVRHHLIELTVPFVCYRCLI